MMRSLLTTCLIVMSLSASAQTDSLTISDTIGVNTQRGNRQMVSDGYRYYGANQLLGYQLQPVLNRSPDVLTRRLARQSRHLSWVSTGLVVSSLGFFVGNLTAAGQRPRPSGSLTLLGYGTLFGSLIPQTMSARRLVRAIALHNTTLRIRPADYVPPVVYAPTRQWPLTLADTIAIRRTGLRYQYTYRGISINPGAQVSRLTASLGDRDVNEGVRYVRNINRIGGIVSGIGQGLLVGYATTLLLTRRYRRTSSIDTDFLTTSLLCIGANFVLTRHTNRAQRRWLVRYNELIKQQFQVP